jgi:DNA-binding LytR/AlgR family response regulator
MPLFQNHTYKDKWFIILLVPFANTINYLLTYSFPKPILRFLLTYGIDTVQGYIAVLIIRYIIILLDKKIGYFQNIGYRLTIQILLTSTAGLLSIALATELVNFIATNKPLPISFYTHNMPIFFIWMLVINGLYVGLYFYHHLLGYQQKIKELEQVQIIKNSMADDTVDNIVANIVDNVANIPVNIPYKENIKPNNIIVSLGQQQVILSWKDIACFYVEDELSLVLTVEGKKYIVNNSLEKIENLVDTHLFFRANRQIIIHKQVIQQINKDENRKLTVFLKPIKDIPTPLTISRIKAPDFKKWLEQA